MPKKVKILTKDQDGNNEEIVDLEFTDDEWETLQDYAKYAAKLEKNSLVQEGIPSSLNVSWTEGEGLKVDTKLPSDEQIDALLMKLRPFLLVKDTPTNFNRVRAIVRKRPPLVSRTRAALADDAVVVHADGDGLGIAEAIRGRVAAGAGVVAVQALDAVEEEGLPEGGELLVDRPPEPLFQSGLDLPCEAGNGQELLQLLVERTRSRFNVAGGDHFDAGLTENGT